MPPASPRPLDGPLRHAADRLSAAQAVWIGTHRDPDGDAIGSLLGLGWVLEALGKDVTLACQDPAPDDVLFLPGTDRIVQQGPADVDLAVAVDAGDLARLGVIVDETAWRAQPSVVVDHHASNPGFGDVNVIDPQGSSTSELILELADAMAADLPLEAVTCLLTGVVTDTLGFRTSNTSAATLRRAARLVTAGASLNDIAERIFATRPLPSMRLLGRAVEHLEVRGRLGLSWLALEDFRDADATDADTQGIANFLAEAQPLCAVALLRDTKDGAVDLSMRSRPGTSLIPVAQSLGGGGHPQASGARLPGPLEDARKRTWRALVAELGTETSEG